jgi:hypothetical protein
LGKDRPTAVVKIADFVDYNYKSQGKGYQSDMIRGNTPNANLQPHRKDQSYFDRMPSEPYFAPQKMQGGPFIA